VTFKKKKKEEEEKKMEKEEEEKKKLLSTAQLELNLRKKIVKCFVWFIAVYGVESQTL